MDETVNPWYSFNWFSPGTLNSFTWENKLYLYFLFLIPVLFAIRWISRYLFNQKLSVALLKSDLKSSPLTWLRLIPEIVISMVLCLLLTALARPQRTNEKVEQWTEGIDIMLAIDISQSMSILLSMGTGFPSTLASYFDQYPIAQWVQGALIPGDWRYNVLYAFLNVFFCFFYTALQVNPVDMADNLKKADAFIPGIRPYFPQLRFESVDPLALVAATANQAQSCRRQDYPLKI